MSRIKSIVGVVIAVFGVTVLIGLSNSVDYVGAQNDVSCATIEVIYARGSGQEVEESRERNRFKSQLDDSVNSPLTVNFYELGSQEHGGHQYPAVNVSDVLNGNAIGAWMSRGYANDYGESVQQGVSEMINYMTNRHEKCKSAGSKFILAGYSQGAQVVGDYIKVALPSIRESIEFVALFGDPKLHLPEGEGIYPPACRGEGEELSAYRRIVPKCRTDNGSLGARKAYLHDDMHNKTGLWCYANDFVCGSSKFAWDTEGHGKYGLEGNAVDSAVKEALEIVQSGLPQEQRQYIEIQKPSGAGTTGIDVMFVIDTTGSMYGRIEQAKQFAAASAERIQALRGRVALVSYRDLGDSYTARIESQLNSDMTEFSNKLQSLSTGGGGDIPEAALHALMTGMNGLSWQNGATKAVILLTDANFHNPDRVDGVTVEQVARRALEIDPVNVYPVVPSYYSSYYQELAELTNGQVIVDSGNTQEALFAALTKLEQRPTALLKNQEYFADVGQQVTYDASDSYVEDADIVSYDWDFDGDGVYELQTITPVAENTYDQLFDGTMQVRLTASNGTIASASAIVKIGTYEPPVSPAAPSNLRVVEDRNSSAVIAWDPVDEIADYWIVSSDGVAIGKVLPETTSVEVGDLVRDEDISFEVAAMTADGMIGDHASVILSSPQAPAPAPKPTLPLPLISIKLPVGVSLQHQNGKITQDISFACLSIGLPLQSSGFLSSILQPKKSASATNPGCVDECATQNSKSLLWPLKSVAFHKC